MLQRPDAADVASHLQRQLNSDFPIVVVPVDDLPKTLIRQLGFSPDVCLRRGEEQIFVHLLAAGEIPRWVRQAREHVRKDLSIFLLAPNTTHAGEVADAAQKLGFGLAFTTSHELLVVFPPRFKRLRAMRSPIEVGHVPRWVYERVAAGSSFSPRLKQIVEEFRNRYARATSRKTITYDGECRILTDLAHSIADADRRLFYPIARLSSLQDFEQSGASRPARDHFFHTFNNFLLGLVILNELFAQRSNVDFPDRLIAKNQSRSRLKLWESLWFITALFHDPGYIPQDFWRLVSFGYGLPYDPPEDPAIPKEVLEKIENAWNTDWLRARHQLGLIYRELARRARADKAQHKLASASVFDSATRLAYFGKNRAGHSLLSGLTLINRCISDPTVHHDHFDRDTAVTAGNIACVSMLFHDQYCRETMASAKVTPIPFNYLPYAAVLMFVDALQDDRRDVSSSRFRARGVLDSLNVDAANGIVIAQVMLRNLQLDQWPYRIAEYHSVMNWINAKSGIKFIIDYIR